MQESGERFESDSTISISGTTSFSNGAQSPMPKKWHTLFGVDHWPFRKSLLIAQYEVMQFVSEPVLSWCLTFYRSHLAAETCIIQDF